MLRTGLDSELPLPCGKASEYVAGLDHRSHDTDESDSDQLTKFKLEVFLFLVKTTQVLIYTSELECKRSFEKNMSMKML